MSTTEVGVAVFSETLNINYADQGFVRENDSHNNITLESIFQPILQSYFCGERNAKTKTLWSNRLQISLPYLIRFRI
jgi:hypothetical protein